MEDIRLCLEEFCEVVEKYSSDAKQFDKIGGKHKTHVNKYFEDLCSNFIVEQDVKSDEFDYKSQLDKVKSKFVSFKDELLQKVDLYQKQVESFILTIINEDKDVQFYQGIIDTQFEKVKQYQDKFFLFQKPEKIKEAYRKKMEELKKKDEILQYIMKDVLVKIDQLGEQSIDIDNIKIQDKDNEHFMNELMKLLEKHQEEILITDSLLAQQETQNQLIQNQTAQSDEMIGETLYNNYQRGLNLGLAYFCKLRTSFKNDLQNQSQKINQDQITIQVLQETKNSLENDLKASQENSDQKASDIKKLIDIQKILREDIQASKETLQCQIEAFEGSQKTLQQTQQVFQQSLKQKDIEMIALQSSLSEKDMQIKSLQIQLQLYEEENFEFSSKYKSPTISITSTNIATRTGANTFDMAVMIPSSPKKVRFGFKIKSIDGNNWIAIGMCHLDTIIDKKYSFSDYAQIGHGSYMVSSTGCSYSSTDDDLNNKVKSFQFTKNNIIYCVYDPNFQTLTFEKVESKEQFVLNNIPSHQQLRPCICLLYANNQVQFIQPEKQIVI